VSDVIINVVDFLGWTSRSDGPAVNVNEDRELRLRVSKILTRGSAIARPFLLTNVQLIPPYRENTLPNIPTNSINPVTTRVDGSNAPLVCSDHVLTARIPLHWRSEIMGPYEPI
jgi:hypothetical protein